MEVKNELAIQFDKTKAVMRSEQAIERFAEALGSGQQAKRFIGSVLLVVSQSDRLMECTPQSIMVSGVRAATLKLSVDPSLGHAYIVPYKNKGIPTATFIIGYKGLKQLAYRTGQYAFINEKIVYDGQTIEEDDFSGIQRVRGIPTTYGKDGWKPIGYWMGFELKNGFRQTFYMTIEEVLAHAQRYSKTYDKVKKQFYSDSLWHTDFDVMAIKTVIRLGLSKYGYFDEDSLLAMAESSEFDDDIVVDGELIEDALEQEAEREQAREAEHAGKSTEQLSSLLGFEDPPDTSKKEPVKKAAAKEAVTKVKPKEYEVAASFNSKRLNKLYGEMSVEELQGEIMALTQYETKTQEEKVQVNDRIQAAKELIRYIESNVL